MSDSDYNFSDLIEVDGNDLSNTGSYQYGYGAVPPASVTIGPDPWVTHTVWTTTGTSGSWNISDVDLTSPPSGKIRLEGEDADIEINGRSLTQILDSIEQRLGMLKCREDLEKDWHELKRLGDQYRALVKDIEEKHKIWDALKR